MRRSAQAGTGLSPWVVVAVAAAIGIAGLAGARSVAAQGGAPESQPISAQAPAMAPALAAGPPADLDLLVTAQVAGWIEPCG